MDKKLAKQRKLATKNRYKRDKQAEWLRQESVPPYPRQRMPLDLHVKLEGGNIIPVWRDTIKEQHQLYVSDRKLGLNGTITGYRKRNINKSHVTKHTQQVIAGKIPEWARRMKKDEEVDFEEITRLKGLMIVPDGMGYPIGFKKR